MTNYLQFLVSTRRTGELRADVELRRVGLVPVVAAQVEIESND